MDSELIQEHVQNLLKLVSITSILSLQRFTGRRPISQLGSENDDRAPFMRRRNTIFMSDPFSSMGSFGSIIRQRPRYYFWNTMSFHKWTNWSACRSRSCRRFRYRKCRRGSKCPAHFLVEMTPCDDAPGCREEKMNITLEKEVTSKCGERPSLSLKIMGGRPSIPNSWPWQASLIMSSSDSHRALPTCGATLIGSQWVITAAHCLVVNYWPHRLPIGRKFRPAGRGMRIRLGDHDVRYQDTHEKLFDVRSITIHPNFKLSIGSCHNDIALIKLNQSVPLHSHVNVACLPSDSMRLPPNYVCTALGWGVVKQEKRRSFFDWFRPVKQVRASVLQEVNIPIVPYRDCRREYPEFALNGTTHLCAGGQGKDTCKGDSGGPLMCAVDVKGVKKWFVYGVTSFGSQNGCGRSFGVYSKVSQFSNWIKRTQLKM